MDAVNKIPITETDNISLPTGSPALRATPPMAACSVAFGRYDITTYSFSFLFKLVFVIDKSTPKDLKIKVMMIRKIAFIPASFV